MVKIMAAVDTFRNKVQAEKLYLQFDKPYYITGDTLWFKAYLFEANFLAAAPQTGICYLEIANDKNLLIKRIMLPVVGGLSWGNIALSQKEFPEGAYILRAYTNLMRNFGEDLIFKKQINIYNSPADAFSFSIKASVNTSGNPENKNISIQNNTDNHPAQLKNAQNIDLQFMPEGGNLVSDIELKIGFKAIGEDGKGVDVSGKIFNSKQEVVASFSSFHKGMGSFEFRSKKNETYTAKLTLPENSTKTYPLPSVKNSGIVLTVNKLPSGDSLEILVRQTPDLQSLNNSYYLIGHSRGLICFAKVIHFHDNLSKSKVSKNIFPSGITCFTLLNSAHNPLTERIIYVDHKDNLTIDLAVDKTTFTPKDSIALHISVSDNEGKPVVGSFSLAVTDQTQVINNPNNYTPITTHLLLTSALKGTVEEPLYYFLSSTEANLQNHTDSVEKALDNLMLTQGWVNYPWDRVFNLKTPEYEAETEFMIRGKTSNSIKGIPNTKVLLYSRNPFLMIDTLSDAEGGFTFKNLHLKDTASFIIQSLNRNGKSFLNTVTIDEFKPPLFTEQILNFAPQVTVKDTLTIKPFVDNFVLPKTDKSGFNDIHVLGEVLVTANKQVKGSKSLNGSGNADQVLNTQDMLKLGKITLLELLRKQIKGFRIKDLDKYYINDYPIKLVMDGLYVDTYDGLFADAMYDPLKENFENFTAEDILGIEVMTSPQYNSIYNTKYLSSDEVRTIGGASAKDYAWLEITTRAGRGAYMKRTAGVVSYKPMPFSLPKQFYSPRYKIKETQNTLPDLRSTIHWEPSIVTDENGKATVSFYSADQPKKYTVIIEGSDMQGNVGTTLKTSFIEILK